MNDEARASEARFVEYIESLAPVLGYVDRAGPLMDYCTGLLLPGERKSVEPIASVVAPSRVPAEHQSLLHFVGQSGWSDEAVLAKVRELVVPAMETQGRIEAWIVDDTGFVKKGVHSVGVARQYCGRLGKTDNCQVAVTLSIANHQASLTRGSRTGCICPRNGSTTPRGARRLTSRRREVPDQAGDRAETDQVRAHGGRGARRRSDRRRYGSMADSARRDGDGADLWVAVQSTMSVWPPGMEPLPPKPWSGRGRKPSRTRRDADYRPVSAKGWRRAAERSLARRFLA